MASRPQTPLRCPIDGNLLRNVQITPLGEVTANHTWELHAGRCPEHGWFQAEVISRPPREIFPVTRPGGAARPIRIAGRLIYSFPTLWDATNRLTAVEMYDPYYWQVDWSRLPEKKDIELLTR